MDINFVKNYRWFYGNAPSSCEGRLIKNLTGRYSHSGCLGPLANHCKLHMKPNIHKFNTSYINV